MAIIVGAVAAFVSSAVWYTLFANPMASLSNTGSTESGTPIWRMLFVIAQSLVIAYMVAYLVSRLGVSGLAGAAGFGGLV